ncbi:S-adenosyl-L-methionine-dependent methyltransferase superfamily protein [Forsythia ovata]|uniref:S-adenosyl-L-methionine-dependent methyltransferase superfamily protein n=1 Tax=Forsythia ovata TaxID=205694 RepID=A0ABD1TAD9_9LAMI
MALVVPSVPNGTYNSSNIALPSMELLGSSLLDLANKGLIDAAKVDSFNLPLYYTYPNELKDLIESNQNFSIERMEIVNTQRKHVTTPDPKSYALSIRAVFEGLLQIHFGIEIMDELFNKYAEKIGESAILLNPNEKSMVTFVLLKRKTIS